MELTAGQAADAPVAEKLLCDLQPGSTVLADKAYDKDTIRAFVRIRPAFRSHFHCELAGSDGAQPWMHGLFLS
jgi:hypothetical protein